MATVSHRPHSFFLEGPAFALYERIRDELHLQEMRVQLDRLWTAFSGLEDSHFLVEARKSVEDCQRRFWEMYLGAALRDMGLPVDSCGNHGPDLTVVRSRLPHIHVECVAPNAGTGPDAAPPPPTHAQFISIDTPQDLRILTAIESKRRAFQTYLDDGVIDPDSPCVIAVNGDLVHGSALSFGVPRIVRLAFGLGQAEVLVPIGPGAVEHDPSLSIPARPFVRKATGSQVSTAVFTRPDMSHISGLIFSIASFRSLELSQPFGSNFVLVINPWALNPLSPTWLPRGETFTVQNDLLVRTRNRRRIETWQP